MNFVCPACGFTGLEKTPWYQIRADGFMRDSVMYSVLKSEWLEARVTISSA